MNPEIPAGILYVFGSIALASILAKQAVYNSKVIDKYRNLIICPKYIQISQKVYKHIHFANIKMNSGLFR